jgi:galactose mutarotase-like enzyme
MPKNVQYQKLGSLAWDRGRLDVQALGGMMGPVEVVLDDGRAIRPFAVAAWADHPPQDWEATAPPLLKRLRGDWLCLPFGLPGKPRTDLDADWLAGLDKELESPDPAQHGACSNADWRLESAKPHALTMSFAPDAKFPISRIERRISAADGAPTIEVETRIAARAPCELPWGVHPTFRLPDQPGAFEIGFGGNVTAFTYPGFFEAGVSRVAHGEICAGIDAVPMLDGSTHSFASLPFAFDTEELLLLARHNGVARLTNRAEGYRVVMEWDPAVFPGLLLWVSNRGRRYAPWNGRHLGLGVEPVCAPFDLGYAHAVNPKSPLRAHGVATATRFSPGRDLETRYRFRFESV